MYLKRLWIRCVQSLGIIVAILKQVCANNLFRTWSECPKLSKYYFLVLVKAWPYTVGSCQLRDGGSSGQCARCRLQLSWMEVGPRQLSIPFWMVPTHQVYLQMGKTYTVKPLPSMHNIRKQLIILRTIDQMNSIMLVFGSLRIHQWHIWWNWKYTPLHVMN